MMDRRVMAAADLLREETFVRIHGMIVRAVEITVKTSRISVDDTKNTHIERDSALFIMSRLQF